MATGSGTWRQFQINGNCLAALCNFHAVFHGSVKMSNNTGIERKKKSDRTFIGSSRSCENMIFISCQEKRMEKNLKTKRQIKDWDLNTILRLEKYIYL